MKVAWLFNTLSVKHLKKGIQVGSLSILQDDDNNKHTYPSWNGLEWWDFNMEKSKHPSQQGVLRLSREVGDRKSEEKGTGKEFLILASQPPSLTLPATQPCESAMGKSWDLRKDAWLLPALKQLMPIVPFPLASRFPPRKPCSTHFHITGWKRKLFWVCISPSKRHACFKCGIMLVQGFKIKIVTSFITVR